MLTAMALFVDAAFAIAAYAPAFSDIRRALVVRVLFSLLELPIAIDADVGLVVADPLKLRISKKQFGCTPGSEDGGRISENPWLFAQAPSIIDGRGYWKLNVNAT